MTLPDYHVREICCVDSPTAQCRYLNEECGSYACLKLSDQRVVIDQAVEEFMQTNTPPEGFPLGDNCDGVPPTEK